MLLRFKMGAKITDFYFASFDFGQNLKKTKQNKTKQTKKQKTKNKNKTKQKKKKKKKKNTFPKEFFNEIWFRVWEAE